MILKILILPFRLVFYILRAVLYSRYLRWLFWMHWLVLLGLAAAVFYLAYQEYELVVGDRAGAILGDAEKSFGGVAVLGGLAAALGLLAVVKFSASRAVARRSSATQSQLSGRDALAERQRKNAREHSRPKGAAPPASPWGTFRPQPQSQQPPTPTKIAETSRNKAKSQPVRPIIVDEPLAQPPFQSVFPGGGSAFRFKSADEIIRQSFGTLQTLTPLKQRD